MSAATHTKIARAITLLAITVRDILVLLEQAAIMLAEPNLAEQRCALRCKDWSKAQTKNR
jgi:hypothetical protein